MRVVVSRSCRRLSGAWLCATRSQAFDPAGCTANCWALASQLSQSSGDELSVGILPASPSERANCVQYVETSCREISCPSSCELPVGGGERLFSRTAVTFLSVTLAHVMWTFARSA